ncbi:MAG: hypothetical protein JNM44_02365 [Chitinophagaceae bacterium]|nr:hypothetical protein [Chitinophagaceae bacterium]
MCYRILSFMGCLFLLFPTALVSAPPRKIQRPEYILFMLNRSENVLESMRKRGMDSKDIQDVIDADEEINSSIIEDFGVNFKFCEVYFFNSEYLNFVIQQQWDSVIFYDYDYQQGKKRIKLSQLQSYYIAEVNHPPAPEYPEIDSNQTRPGSLLDGDDPYVSSRDYGVRLYTPAFKLVPGKLQFTNGTLYRKGNMFSPKDLKWHFTGAKRFHQKLTKYYAEP